MQLTNWHIRDFQPGEGEQAGAHLLGYDAVGWLPATVPGDVHLDLLRAARIPDPFVGMNFREVAWVAEREWWYRTAFQAPQPRDGPVELTFHGLDCFATIWLNGERLGESANMWLPARFDISRFLRPGANVLAVRLDSPRTHPTALRGRQTGFHDMVGNGERFYTRKAQMSYGWDIAPNLVTVGIWRPVEVVARPAACIRDLWVRLAQDDPEKVLCDVALEGFADLRGARLVIEGRCGDSAFEAAREVQVAPGTQTVSLEARVANPRLWSIWEAGAPNLYTVSVELRRGEEVLDRREIRAGLRTIRLVEEPLGNGTSFVFEVNARPTFMRGLNWTPADALFARVGAARYRRLVALARECNVNIFRVWGGGIYEDPAFYDACDEAGILVWQDFMFACSDYPSDPDFLEAVRREAEWVVRSLRSHPSVAVWCGNNENESGQWYRAGCPAEKSDWSREPGYALFQGLLPRVCAALDPTRPFRVSSPWGGPHPQSPLAGDTHIWHHGTHYNDRVYAGDESRFVSEIGHLSVPGAPTLRSFLGEGTIWPPANPTWDHHFGTHTPKFEPHRRERLDDALRAFAGELPTDLETYVRLSQLLQGRAYQAWIEHYRRRKFASSGILCWNLADNWPQMSDAIVDYFLRPKLAYHFCRRAFEPVLLSFADDGDGIGLWLINDTREQITGQVTVAHLGVDGRAFAAETMAVQADDNALLPVPLRRLAALRPGAPEREFLHAAMEWRSRRIEAWHFFVDDPRLALPPATLSASADRVDARTWRVTVQADAFAHAVTFDGGSRVIGLEDNAFHVLPDTARTVLLRLAEGEAEGPITLTVRATNAPSVEVGVGADLPLAWRCHVQRHGRAT